MRPWRREELSVIFKLIAKSENSFEFSLLCVGPDAPAPWRLLYTLCFVLKPAAAQLGCTKTPWAPPKWQHQALCRLVRTDGMSSISAIVLRLLFSQTTAAAAFRLLQLRLICPSQGFFTAFSVTFSQLWGKHTVSAPECLTAGLIWLIINQRDTICDFPAHTNGRVKLLDWISSPVVIHSYTECFHRFNIVTETHIPSY